VGVGLLAAFCVWMILGWPFSNDNGQAILHMAVAEAVLGRAATMAVGYSLGLGQGMVVGISVVLETILVLIFYPLFVFSWQQLLVIKGMKRWFERMHEAAEIHKDKVQRYGIAGLFVFVWLPFWMTGPAVGCVIGFLLGLRAWVNMTVVLGATYVAILGWAFLLKKFHDQLAGYNRFAGLIVVGAVVVLFGIMRATAKVRRRKKHNGE
jgi:uncharacterized membrane protein